jgi:hypothetical protein
MYYYGKLVRENLPFAVCIPCKLHSARGAVSLAYIRKERSAKLPNTGYIDLYSVSIILLT